MATKATAGRKGKLYWLGGTSSGSATKIAEVHDWGITPTMAEIDATSVDSSGWAEAIDGERSWTMTASVANISSDTPQRSIMGAYTSGVKQWYKLLPSTSKTQAFQGFGWVTGYNVAGNTKDLQLRNLTIKGTAKLKYSS